MIMYFRNNMTKCILWMMGAVLVMMCLPVILLFVSMMFKALGASFVILAYAFYGHSVETFNLVANFISGDMDNVNSAISNNNDLVFINIVFIVCLFLILQERAFFYLGMFLGAMIGWYSEEPMNGYILLGASMISVALTMKKERE